MASCSAPGNAGARGVSAGGIGGADVVGAGDASA
jgi:hypothetical protein